MLARSSLCASIAICFLPFTVEPTILSSAKQIVCQQLYGVTIKLVTVSKLCICR